jgi:poly(3-hydroxybutyrate) depolymerase
VKWYGLKASAEKANIPIILVAPNSTGCCWAERDHALFDDIVEYLEDNLCVDTTRIFKTGYSYGGMITYSLSTNHQHKIRAAVGLAPANYNIWLPATKLKEPIAWMHVTGMRDATCPWVASESERRGGKFIALEKAADNGCEIPAEIPTWKSGNHVTYEFKNCKAGYPTIVSTLNSGHPGIDQARDPGASSSWVHTESWEFYMRF